LQDVEGDQHGRRTEDARVGAPEEMETGDEMLVEDGNFAV